MGMGLKIVGLMAIGGMVLGLIGLYLPSGVVQNESDFKYGMGLWRTSYDIAGTKDSGTYECEDTAGVLVAGALGGAMVGAMTELANAFAGFGFDDDDDDDNGFFFNSADRSRRDALVKKYRERRADDDDDDDDGMSFLGSDCVDSMKSRCGAGRGFAALAIFFAFLATCAGCCTQSKIIVAGLNGVSAVGYLAMFSILASYNLGKAENKAGCGMDGELGYGFGFIVIILAFLTEMAAVVVAFMVSTDQDTMG
jgi:hypothetical protein